MPGAAPRSGQPRPISLWGRACRPYRRCFRHRWSGIENPNGSEEKIGESLLEAKKEVVALRDSVKAVVDLLKIPLAVCPAPPPAMATHCVYLAPRSALTILVSCPCSCSRR